MPTVMERAYERMLSTIERAVDQRLYAKKELPEKLIPWCQRFLPHYFTDPPSELHEWAAEQLLEAAKARGLMMDLEGPRGSAKSTVATLGYPLYAVCNELEDYLLLIADTNDQAKLYLENIAYELENNAELAEAYPHACGKGRTWNKNSIITKNGIRLDALGAGKPVRGRRKQQHRPSCHVVGTKIWHEGRLLKIEESPFTRTRALAPTVAVSVHGVPEPEFVTTDHRYWAMKKVLRYGPGKKKRWVFLPAMWTYASELTRDHWIGGEIDQTTAEPQAIRTYSGHNRITGRGQRGHVRTCEAVFEQSVPAMFADPEWWWAFGLWLGDGSVWGPRVYWCCAKKYPETVARLKRLFSAYGGFTTTEDAGPGYLNLSWAQVTVARWLKAMHVARGFKSPPAWVFQLKPAFLSAVVNGYLDSDGCVQNADRTKQKARIASINEEILLRLSAALARLGVPSYVRKCTAPRLERFGDRWCVSRTKYDLYIRDGASALGLPLQNPTRYAVKKCFIEGGFIWRKVRSVATAGEREVVPIQTPSHTYETPVGRSHNCVIVDDPEGEAATYSLTIRTRIKNWFDRAVLHVGGPRTNFFVIGTRLHNDCCTARLATRAAWRHRSFKAIESWPVRMDLWAEWELLYTDLRLENREKVALEFYLTHRQEMDEGAKVLWEAREPLYALMCLRANGHAAFEAEKQGNPIDPSVCEFQPEYFAGDDVYFLDWPRDLICKVMSLDPSKGRQDRSGDFQAIIKLGYSTEGAMYVDADIARRPLPEMMNVYLRECEHFRPDVAVVEADQFQELILPMCEQEAVRQRIIAPIEPIETEGVPKVMRVRRLGPHVSRRRFRFKQRSPGVTLLLQQLQEFPVGDHDDGPDALEMCVRKLTEFLADSGGVVDSPY